MAATSHTLEPEWSFLRAACSATVCREDSASLQPPESIRWKLLFDLAAYHGVQPLLYHSLAQAADSVPPAEMAALRQRYQHNLHKALFLSRELIRIVDQIAELGIDVMPYKGLALAEVLYADIALRQAGDIDLLIRPQDLPRVREAVGSLGYTPHLALSLEEERAYLKSGYELAFDGTAGPNLLEVQWAIHPRFYAIDFDMNALFQRAMRVDVAGHAVKTPAHEDLLLVLSAHAAKHVWTRLAWLCDIARVMTMPDLDWPRIASHAAALGMTRILLTTLKLASQLLSVDIPAAATNALPADAASQALADEIRAILGPATDFNVESLTYFRLMLRLRERRSDRLKFLRRLIFTPGPGEWKAVRLPAPLFPLYLVVRLSRLAARAVRS